MNNNKPQIIYRIAIGIFVLLMAICRAGSRLPNTTQRTMPASIEFEKTVAALDVLVTAQSKDAGQTFTILVDDFKPQPYQGDPSYSYNRLDGDRGGISDTTTEWEQGNVKLSIAPSSTWGGIWMSLNHPIREGKQINFSAILPAPIKQEYQSNVTGIQVQVMNATPGRFLKLELKNGDVLLWSDAITLNGDTQLIEISLPALNNINHLVLVLDQAQPNDYVVIERISFAAQTQIKDTATAAFVWSYGMLLENWNPHTGLVRDKAKDASGEFDAIQATGNLAAATAAASQLGIIERTDAIQIVDKIGDTLLNKIPRLHGLLPHWVKMLPTGEFVIVDGTEWSSVDTVIAVLGLLEAQSSLGMDTSATEQLLKDIDWDALVTPNGISHGYTYAGTLIPYGWDVFGGESWLVQLAYASATGQVAPLAYPSPPTANGSGFIDELAWLYIPPPNGKDIWKTNWNQYRKDAVQNQIAYYPNLSPEACFAKLGLFGLSAGEVPAPWLVPQHSIYQAYGVGGAFGGANDGLGFGSPVVAPHYSAMIASVRPKDSLKMWNWLIDNGYFTPLNNIESLTFTDESNCTSSNTEWNQLKGSWNLSLQALGWGRYLTEQRGGKFGLWQAMEINSFLKNGYFILAGQPK